MRDRAFGRRDLLRAAGATLLVPAFLREAFAAPQTLGPRLVIMMQALGTHQRAFWPDATGTSPILDPILSEPSLKAKTLVIKGIANDTKGLGNEHDRGFNSLWTGVAPVGVPEDCFGGGESIDQNLRRALDPKVPKVRFPSLNCGVLAADVAPKNGHRRSFSYIGPQQQLPTRIDPYRMYAMLFPETGTDTPERAAQRLALKQSVLDHTASDLAALRGRLGSAERHKLDGHTTALREYESRLSGAASTCARPSPFAPGIEVMAEDNVPVLTELMLDLMAVALGCNLTRIVTFQLGYCGNQWRYRWLGIDKDSHEEIAHFDAPNGSAVTAAVTSIGQWVAGNVARFAKKLDAIPDGSGTALDNSLVVWANENSDGSHGMENLPIVFLGRAGGRLSRTGLVDEGRQSHYQLCTSVLNLMGVEAHGFGDNPQSGPLRGVV